MNCVVCRAQERDLNDIQRRIADLVIDLRRAVTVAGRDHIGLEVRALAAAKAELERRHLQHKKSSQHETTTGYLGRVSDSLDRRP
jgi:hypothetical protein